MVAWCQVCARQLGCAACRCAVAALARTVSRRAIGHRSAVRPLRGADAGRARAGSAECPDSGPGPVVWGLADVPFWRDVLGPGRNLYTKGRVVSLLNMCSTYFAHCAGAEFVYQESVVHCLRHLFYLLCTSWHGVTLTALCADTQLAKLRTHARVRELARARTLRRWRGPAEGSCKSDASILALWAMARASHAPLHHCTTQTPMTTPSVARGFDAPRARP